jgi:hypothetical protein
MISHTQGGADLAGLLVESGESREQSCPWSVVHGWSPISELRPLNSGVHSPVSSLWFLAEASALSTIPAFVRALGAFLRGGVDVT